MSVPINDTVPPGWTLTAAPDGVRAELRLLAYGELIEHNGELWARLWIDGDVFVMCATDVSP